MYHGTVKKLMVDKVSPDFWALLYSINKPVLVRFFGNVRFLMDKRGITLTRLQSDLRASYGFRVSRNAVCFYQTREKGFNNASLAYLSVYCAYFGEDFVSMVSRDYRAEAELKDK